MSDSKEELKHRVLAKKHQLQEKLEKLQAEAHGSATDESDRIKAQLKEVDDIVRDGWDSLAEAATSKLNEWLK